MRKYKKILIISINLILILFLISTTVFGRTIIDNFDDRIKTDVKDTGEIEDIGNKVVGIIQVVGMIVSVGILMVLGIKYMMGSVEEKAQYKKTMLPYLIGAVLLFGATGFAQVIYDWAKSIK